MSLLPGNITGIAASEEVHIFCCGELPEYGEHYSIPCKERDTGLTFTVSSPGISAFVLNNTTLLDTTHFTITTFFDLKLGAFTSTHQAVRASIAAQKQKNHSRSMGKLSKLPLFRSCSMLRL